MSNFEIKKYRTGKSILPSYQFKAEFECEFEHTIQPHHVRSVSFEQHTFKHEGQYHGPGILKIFPVLDRGENGAYRLTVVMEEDRFGNVFNFIESLKRLIINENGIYNKRSIAKSTKLKLYMYGGDKSFFMKFENVYFQSADGGEWSYGSSEQKVYTLNLVYENYTFGFPEQEDLVPPELTEIANEKPKIEEPANGEGTKSKPPKPKTEETANGEGTKSKPPALLDSKTQAYMKSEPVTIPSITPNKNDTVVAINKALNEDPTLTEEDKQILLRVAKIESSYKADATNPKSSARGLYQMLDKTADAYYTVIGSDSTPENRNDPYLATKAQIAFYKKEQVAYYNEFHTKGTIAGKKLTPELKSSYSTLTKAEFTYGLIHHDGVGNAAKGKSKGGVDYYKRQDKKANKRKK